MSTPNPSTPTPRTASPRALALIWLASRALMLVVWALAESFVVGDVVYYHRRISSLFSGELPLSATLIEYPTPVVALLSIPQILGFGTQTGYIVVFVVGMLALDAWLAIALWRHAHDARPVLWWTAFVVLLGPLVVLRFDMIPAVLAGVALLWWSRRPAVGGALIGLGAAVKLWPALLIGGLLTHPRRWRSSLLAAVATGGVLALISLLAGGFTRLLSPLTWQSARGLQIESVWATPLMLVKAWGGEHAIAMSKYQAFEIFGPGAVGLASAADLSMLVGLALVALLTWRGIRWGLREPEHRTLLVPALIMLTVVLVMIVTNKTLSPQYLLWLGGPLAVAVLASAGEDAATVRQVGWLGIGGLVLSALTHLVYPLLYDVLLGAPPGPALQLASVVLLVRNLGLVVLTVLTARLCWRLTSTARLDTTG